ncbi:MAG: N-acetylmannosamine-6-phosphate 2-epimerase, partial [Calditrichaeota bacterium]|nr:N-acetylmannosamine-6-phosphate 2-epimerase [Calditrichota bacterium]
LMGGAVGIRANLPQNIRAMLKALDVPVIGIYKKVYQNSEVFITPTLRELKALLRTGVPIVAMDATDRQRPSGQDLEDLVAYARANSSALLMADISAVEEGLRASELGFDLIGTTLAGYTEYTKKSFNPEEPDFKLIADLSKSLEGRTPVIAEGRIWFPEQAIKSLKLGAFAVVVGTAITRPWAITQRFVKALKKSLV